MVWGPVEQSLQKGAVGFYTHRHLKVMVAAFFFTRAVSSEPMVHEKVEKSLAAFPEPVILYPYRGVLGGIER